MIDTEAHPNWQQAGKEANDFRLGCPDMLAVALAYLRNGWTPIPLCWPDTDGKCACPKQHAEPRDVGKAPLLGVGYQHTRSTEDEVRQWWTRWPNANIGILVEPSNLLVVDLDGDAAIHEVAAHGVPPTPMARTGRVEGGAGQHRFFQRAERCPIASTTRQGASRAIDVKTNGYVVVAPSLHHSGRRYEWELSPEEAEPDDAPEWAVRLLKETPSRPSSSHPDVSGDLPAVELDDLPLSPRMKRLIREGREVEPERYVSRSEALFAAIHALYGIGCDDAVIAAVILEPKHRIGDKAREQGWSWLMGEIARARVKAGESSGDALAQARAVAATVCDQVATDCGAAFTPEALHALNILKDQDLAELVRVRESLKQRGVRLRDLDQALKHAATGADVSANKGDSRRRTAGDMLEDVRVPWLIIPEPYSLGPDMTSKLERSPGGGQMQRTIAYSPILITGRVRDEGEGIESLRLSWSGPNGWQERTVDRGVVLDGKRLVDLASNGFPVSSENARDVVSYLHRLEAANRDRLQTIRVSGHLGWQGKQGARGFLWGRTCILSDGSGQVLLDLDDLLPEDWNDQWIAFRGLATGDEQVVEGCHAAGTPDDWLRVVRPVADFPKPLLAFYASFVPPLLAVIGAPNFILDLANRTSTGKTTTLRVAASVWGRPDERAPDSVLWSWDTTRVGGERLAATLSGLPLILDDTKRARNSRDVSDMLYLVANGRGRVRGNKSHLAGTGTWNTVLLSTGEAPATSFTQDGGTRTRCMEVRGLPFGTANGDTRLLVEHLNFGVQAHYGHAGPAFVTWLLKHRSQWDRFREEYRQKVGSYAERGASPEAGRLASYAAAIDMAATLAHAALDLPWSYRDPLASVWADIVAEAGDAAGEERALRDVVSWAYSHRDAFYHGSSGGQESMPPGGWAGKWDRDEKWSFLAFLPTVLKKVLTEMGYEPEAILSGWRERGWLEHERRRYTKQVRVPNFTSAPQMVVIRRGAIEKAGA